MTQKGINGIWTNRWTFILAATGSAVGLGNIWKFPYIAGENGGGAFVLVYLACIAVIGIPVMMAEAIIGRKSRMSPINAMRSVAKEAGANKIWSGVGWMGVLAGLFIMSFYSVVAGWALNYVVSAANGVFTNATPEAIGENFNALLANPSTLILWHTVFSVITGLVVALGVTKGLGAVAKYMMPFLFGALILLVGYSFTHGDFSAGLHFLFDFNLGKLSWSSVLTALGHAFFTLSLGMGAIMAYGAYMPGNASLGKTILTVGLLDTVVALVAGLAIFPIVFATASIEPSDGPGLLFVSLPVAFGSMPFGTIFGTLFFLLISVAAWSSSVSLIEPGVAWLVEGRKMKRAPATLLLTGSAWAMGIGCALSLNVLKDFTPWFLLNQTLFNFFDFITAKVMLPLGGVFIALFVGWFMNKAALHKELETSDSLLFNVWILLLRFVSPILVLLVMGFALHDSVGATVSLSIMFFLLAILTVWLIYTHKFKGAA